MAYLTEKNIETIAYSIVQQYMNVYNISSNEVFKVSPENVANILGIKIEYVDFNDKEVLGKVALCNMKDMISEREVTLNNHTVYMNEQLLKGSSGHRNFVTMCGISFLILNHINSNLYGEKYRKKPITLRDAPSDDIVKGITSTLALEILMPKETVNLVFNKVYGVDKLNVINPVVDKGNFIKFNAMADMFGVTKEILAIRLQNMGKLTEYQFCGYENLLQLLMAMKNYHCKA